MSIFKVIKRAVKVATFSIMATPALGIIGYAAVNWEELNQPLSTPTEKTREARFKIVRAELPERTNTPVEWIDCLLERESFNGKVMVKKFEPRQMGVAGKITKEPELQREYASSHGPFQIMGFHVKLELNGDKHDRGDFVDLYDPDFAAEQFARIFGDCRRANTEKTMYEHVEKSSACYNGTGPSARQYGKEVAACVARKSIERLKG